MEDNKKLEKEGISGLAILADPPIEYVEPDHKKKVLVVGKGSYIGTAVRNYLNRNSDFYTVDELDVRSETWESFDFSVYGVVFQVAGIAHQKETDDNAHLYYKVNRDLAIRVAGKAKAAGVGQFIYMSSMSVYGVDESKEDITLSTPTNPTTNYGWSKLQAEEELEKLNDDGFAVSYLRPPMVYGEGAPGNLERLFAAVRKIHLFPTIKNERSTISITNLCEAVKEVIDANTSGLIIPQDSNYRCTVDAVKEQMSKEGVKVVYTPLFNPAIRFLTGRVGLVTKAFGNLRYQKV